jgi:hypothetical protein
MPELPPNDFWNGSEAPGHARHRIDLAISHQGVDPERLNAVTPYARPARRAFVSSGRSPAAPPSKSTRRPVCATTTRSAVSIMVTRSSAYGEVVEGGDIHEGDTLAVGEQRFGA